MADSERRLSWPRRRGTTYTRYFYAMQEERARRSAQPVVALLTSLLAPASVVDIGCGTGAWLAELLRAGVKDVLGLDGPAVDLEHLSIPASRFLRHDLTKPLILDRRFDLVLALEVAEHLEAAQAQHFVHLLTTLGPVVAFSAAIPHQGGQHHVNEQWPDYWRERFGREGYVASDCVRDVLWEDERIEPHYRQNLVLFVDEREEALLDRVGRAEERSLTRIHSEIYLSKADPRQMSLRSLVAALPLVVVSRIRSRLR